jgi:hypothetical protein
LPPAILPASSGGEAAAQHGRDEVHPPRVILDAAPRIELAGADADDLGHLLEASTYRSMVRKKCQMPTEPPVSAIARMTGVDLPTA